MSRVGIPHIHPNASYPKKSHPGILSGSYRHGFTCGHKPRMEFTSWDNMLARCCNPKHPNYSNYGARGITVCEQWRNSFEAFLEDMGESLSPKHTIDRIDNNGNYEPGNCRWATRKEQCNNKRDNRLIEISGASKTLAQWAEWSGIRRGTLAARLDVSHWPTNRLLEPVDPAQSAKKKGKKHTR